MSIAVSYVQCWFKAVMFCLGLATVSNILLTAPVMAQDTVTSPTNTDKKQAETLYKQAIDYMNDAKNAKANQQKIMELLTQSATQGYAQAQVDLGKVYYFGLAGVRDDSQALVWFKKAAEQGDAQGQYHLGQMYTEGKGGLKESEKEAAVWYQKSATQGYAPAQYYLAILYLTGIDDIEKDSNKALDLLQKAAKQGDQDAIQLLNKLQPLVQSATGPAQ